MSNDTFETLTDLMIQLVEFWRQASIIKAQINELKKPKVSIIDNQFDLEMYSDRLNEYNTKMFRLEKKTDQLSSNVDTLKAGILSTIPMKHVNFKVVVGDKSFVLKKSWHDHLEIKQVD